MEKRFTGTVVRATGSWYDVLHDGAVVRCRIRGRLRLRGVRSTNPVVVGDEVTCEADAGGDYVICDISPRRNYVIRRASNLSKESHIIAANVDQALLMATLRSPETATEFVDRFLVTCEAYKVPVTILLSKIDLQDPQAVADFHAVYESAGYRVMEVSSATGEGVGAVHELLKGRTTLVSGNSGVGKSTLIRAILGQREYEGKITFHSADGKQTRLRIGYVPQSPAFDPADPISVLDLFTCCIAKRPAFLRPGKALREKVLECLSRVHGESLIGKRVGTLSGGELQRVLLALALEPMPNMLILDEPLSGVDVEGMELLMDMLDEIRKTYDLSILMTTHDFSMLERYADRVVLLREKILCKGTPLEVLNSDEFAQAFHLGGAK